MTAEVIEAKTQETLLPKASPFTYEAIRVPDAEVMAFDRELKKIGELNDTYPAQGPGKLFSRRQLESMRGRAKSSAQLGLILEDIQTTFRTTDDEVQNTISIVSLLGIKLLYSKYQEQELDIARSLSMTHTVKDAIDLRKFRYCGGLFVQYNGVTLQDVLTEQVPQGFNYLDYYMNICLAGDEDLLQIARDNASPTSEKFPQMHLANVIHFRNTVVALMNSDHFVKSWFKNANFEASSIAQRRLCELAIDRSQAFRDRFEASLFSLDPEESKTLRDSLNSLLDKKDLNLDLVLTILGFNKNFQPRYIYRVCNDFIDEGVDVNFFTKLRDLVVLSEDSKDRGYIISNNRANQLVSFQALTENDKSLGDFNEWVEPIRRKLLKGKPRAKYELDPEKVDWDNCERPTHVTAILTLSRGCTEVFVGLVYPDRPLLLIGFNNDTFIVNTLSEVDILTEDGLRFCKVAKLILGEVVKEQEEEEYVRDHTIVPSKKRDLSTVVPTPARKINVRANPPDQKIWGLIGAKHGLEATPLAEFSFYKNVLVPSYRQTTQMCREAGILLRDETSIIQAFKQTANLRKRIEKAPDGLKIYIKNRVEVTLEPFGISSYRVATLSYIKRGRH